jgi:GNAT superfamily N-acetyltransferase
MQMALFTSELADGVCRCYNDVVAPLPYCYAVPRQRFASLEKLASDRVRDEVLTVALGEEGEVVGFVHAGISLPPREEGEPPGELAVIRFLCYRPGERVIGKALLEWAEDWARERRRKRLLAFNMAFRYPFYHFPCAHLSEHMGHVRALFGMHGYGEHESEVLLVWRHFAPPRAERLALDFELVMDRREGPLGLRLEVKATQQGREVGSCAMDRGQASPAPDAREWCWCDSLWVEGRLQGQGLGRFLISTALQEMHAAGCRHAAISTSWDNHRAALLYTSLGYRHADRTCCYARDL